jgi:linoleoyl-CoA desaturase
MAHNLILWNANAWFFHHVYYHHSFTGLENDPDDSLYHFGFITQKNGRLNLIHIFYMLFPGQQFGLAFLYLLMSFTKRYYYIKTQLPTLQYYDTIDMLMCLFKFYCFYRGGIILFVIHALIVNTLYYINVYPNHSTYDTKIENRDGVGSNWTKLQICNTGNFVMDNLWWTRFFGGINYQIEHHLFPNMSNIHYPYVSKIVREYCKEHNIPYVNKATLYDAYISFVKYVQHY